MTDLICKIIVWAALALLIFGAYSWSKYKDESCVKRGGQVYEMNNGALNRCLLPAIRGNSNE